MDLDRVTEDVGKSARMIPALTVGKSALLGDFFAVSAAPAFGQTALRYDPTNSAVNFDEVEKAAS